MYCSRNCLCLSTCINLVVLHSVCLYISLVISDYMVFGFNQDIRIRIRIRIPAVAMYRTSGERACERPKLVLKL